MTPLRVFIGFDSREREAYEVAAHSLRRHSSIPLAISPLKLDRLRANGRYTRPHDKLAATEFSLTRFLVPALCDFKGYALFFDCDFLWKRDVHDLLGHVDPEMAVSVVKHNYHPSLGVKMDGRPQSSYPRKNWSSLMIFNNERCTNLTLEYVNTATPAQLHQFRSFLDSEIGGLPREWNWLEGEKHYDQPRPPAAVHFTNGGPWFPHARHIEFGDDWIHELNCAVSARLPE